MSGTGGGYISSLSAVDSAGVEGGYYLWWPEELERLLGADERRVLSLTLGLRGAPRHEAGLLPMRETEPARAAEELGLTVADVERLESHARLRLLRERANRDLPRDGKQLAGWNGLALSALVAGARELGDARYRRAAADLRGFLVNRLWDGRRLHRAAHAAGWIGESTLEDYAFVARGLSDWADLAGSEQDRALARRLVRLAWALFFRDGGWSLASEPLLPGVPLESAFTDSPLPSPSAVLLRMTLESPDPELAARAHAALERSFAVTLSKPFAFSSHLMLLVSARQ
jgi:uncharacterized protein YyaL (SSP411 family)